MKLEDLQAEVLKLNKEKEELSSMLKSKDELIEGLKTKNEEYSTKITDYQEKIMTLRDLNTDLFLRVSQPVPVNEPEPEVEEPEITTDDIVNQW